LWILNFNFDFCILSFYFPTMFDLISIGEAGIDTLVAIHEASIHCNLNKEDCQICFNYADKITADSLDTKTAHNAMNNAVGAARLGLTTALYAHVGNDPSGARILETLRHEGVATRYVAIERSLRSVGSVVINFRGERTILVHHVSYRYQLPAFSRTKWFYLTSMGHTFAPPYRALAKRIGRTGERLGLNPGPIQLRAGRSVLRPVLKATTVLFLNKEEARLLTGVHEERDVKELLRAMSKLGPSTAVITDGPKGSYAFDGQRAWSLPVFPAPVIERTGAGDSFATAFVAALIHGQGIGEALRWGAVNSASVIQKIGPQDGLLRLATLRSTLRKHPRFQPRAI
jgi:ribokinase